jgi:Flp pilus assembly protein TadD
MHAKTLIAVSAFSLLGGCATTQPVEITPVQRTSNAVAPQTADRLAADGNLQQAIVAYQAALQTNPEDLGARFGYAEALRRSGKWNDAKAQYSKLLDHPEWKLKSLEGIGRASLAAGDRDSAHKTLSEVVNEDSKAWKSWLVLAEIHDLDRNWAKADEAYALALDSTNQPALIYNNQGVSRLARGEAQWAVDHFRQALATDPSFERAMTNLQLAEAMLGKSAQQCRLCRDAAGPFG